MTHVTLLCIPKPGSGIPKVVRKATSLPFKVQADWVIPSVQIGQREVLTQVQHWSLHWSDLTMQQVLDIWDKGFEWQAGTRKVWLAPLRLLEHPLLRRVWKYSGDKNTVCKNVAYIKAVVFAIHRRVLGQIRRIGDTSTYQRLPLSEAMADLNSFQLQRAQQGGRQKLKGPKATLSKLAGLISAPVQQGGMGEFTPEGYLQYLGEETSIFLQVSQQWGVVE